MSVEPVHNDPFLQRENTQWLITRASGGRRRKRAPGTGTSSASSSQRWSSHSSVSYRTSCWPQQRRAALEKLRIQCYSIFYTYQLYNILLKFVALQLSTNTGTVLYVCIILVFAGAKRPLLFNLKTIFCKKENCYMTAWSARVPQRKLNCKAVHLLILLLEDCLKYICSLVHMYMYAHVQYVADSLSEICM